MRDVPDSTAADAPTAVARPRLRSDLHVERRDGRVIVFSQVNQTVLRARAFVEVVPLLDGTRSLSDVTAALSGRLSAPEIHYAINQLTARGLVVWHPVQGDPARAAWTDLAGIGAGAFARSIELSTVAGADGALLRGQLQALDLSVVQDDPKALLIVLAPNALDPALAEIDRAARLAGRPWLLLAETGRFGQVGPLFLPEDGACWQCLAHRLAEARQAESWLARLGDAAAPRPPRVGIPASRTAFAAFAASQILRNTAPTKAPLRNRMLRRDALGFSVTEHVLTRRPQCPTCGTAKNQGPRVLLDPAPAPLVETGGPAALETLIDPVLGIVQSVEDGIRTENDQVYTGIARHFFPMFKDEVKVLKQNLHGRSGGKGTTARAARTSALGEAVERYSGVWQGDWEQTLQGSARDLQGVVPLDALLNFSPAQYAGRTAWNRALKSPHQVVPEPLDPTMMIDWTRAWSLTHQQERLLPSAYCWYGHPDLKRTVCFADSNGCAAASSRELALMKGLTELIERDAVALWWYCRARRPGLDLYAFADAEIAALLARYDQLGRDVWALDISTEFGLPVVVALCAARDGESEDIVFGFGSGPDPRAAVANALGEMSQSYVYVSERAPDGSTHYRAENGEMLDWLKSVTRGANPWLCPAPGLDLLGPHDLPSGRWDSPAAAVDALTCRLNAEGIEVIALDQTRPDIGVPVMRAVAPGLRHFWRRLGPGRLYDAPVKLGWLDSAPTEADLNPFSIFI